MFGHGPPLVPGVLCNFFFIFRPDKNAKRKKENYSLKAEKFGYRGSRESFEVLQSDLEKQDNIIKDRIVFYPVFIHVKKILDSVKSVTNNCY